MNLIIRRFEESIKDLKGWLLVYGRRKVGKTFLLRRVFSDAYYFVMGKTGYVIFDEKGRFSYLSVEEAVKRIGELLDGGETVIFDEFQRLPDRFWDLIALHHPNGRFIASGSSLGIVRKVFDKRSPLLGLFTPFKIDLIKYSDTIVSIKSVCSSLKDVFLWGLIVRDPWIIPMVSFKEDFISEFCGKAYYFVASALGLVGEVFEEEERALTRVYDAVLRLIGEGFWKPSDIAGILISNGLITGGLPTITGLLDRMVSMGFLEKVDLWKTRGARYYFKHRSPLLSILYYIDQKFHISEGGYRSIDADTILSIIGREIQFSLGEMLAEYFGGRRSCILLPSGGGDIDIVVLDSSGKNPIIGFEVKLGKFSRSEAEKSIEIIHLYGIPKAGLISLSDTPPIVSGVYEVFGPEEIIEIAEKVYSKNIGEN